MWSDSEESSWPFSGMEENAGFAHRGCRNVKRFRGELLFEVRRHLYHSNIGWGIINKETKWRTVVMKNCEPLVPGPALAIDTVNGRSCRNDLPFKNNCSAEMWSGSEEGSYLKLIDCCITQL